MPCCTSLIVEIIWFWPKMQEEIDRKLMEAFFFRDALPHYKLADIISGKIK